jgi:hypothetical protein
VRIDAVDLENALGDVETAGNGVDENLLQVKGHSVLSRRGCGSPYTDVRCNRNLSAASREEKAWQGWGVHVRPVGSLESGPSRASSPAFRNERSGTPLTLEATHAPLERTEARIVA